MESNWWSNCCLSSKLFVCAINNIDCLTWNFGDFSDPFSIFKFFCLIYLPSVFYWHSAKPLFAECYKNFWSVSNDLGWRNSQHQSCRSRKVKKLCSSQLFYLNSFRISNMCLNFSNLKFKFCKWSQIKKLTTTKL